MVSYAESSALLYCNMLWAIACESSPECGCLSSPTAVMVQRSQSRTQSQPLAVRRLRLLRWVHCVTDTGGGVIV